MTKNCLIIDNEDQTSSIETITREAKKKGLIITCYQFNVGSTHREDLLKEGKIDIEKVTAKFIEEFKGIHFDLIAFDWDLSDTDVNGINLIKHFQDNAIRKNTPKILYSGVLKDEIESLLDKHKNNSVAFKEVWMQLSTLIKVDIRNFVDRTEYEGEIVIQIGKAEEPLDLIIESNLRKFPDMIFQNTFPNFKGMSFSQIADLIEKDVPQGNSFKKEIIEQVISYLAKVNA